MSEIQTFLPYPDFFDSAKVLDRARLGKQRVETLTIMRILAGQITAWKNHPAVRMWEGHPESLMDYQYAICSEWTNRGYEDNCLVWTNEAYLQIPDIEHHGEWADPWWLGDDRFHSSHRSNLLRKNSEWYGQFGWDDDPTSPYWWPTKEL